MPNNNTDIFIKDSSVYGSKYFYIKNNKMLSLLRHYEYNIKERNELYVVDEDKTSQSITFKYKTNSIDTRLQLGYHSYPLINNGSLFKTIRYKKFKKEYEFGDMFLSWFVVFDKSDVLIIDVNIWKHML